ncbi:MAG: cupin domain-containing protein [Actinobacteria bacterium]|nr:cupin domain-containing protein [Actinomycetota bacterium]
MTATTKDSRQVQDVEGSPAQSEGAIGVGLRTLRRERGLTLAEVAEATQISVSFLSLVENERSDITIGRLIRLMQFYGVSLADLLPDLHGADPEVVPVGERQMLQSPSEGINIFVLSSNPSRAMMPMLVEFEPGAGRWDYGQHAGHEFLFVLEGELVLELDGSQPRWLRVGDAACYSAERPHLLRNGSETEPMRLICVDSSRVP